MSTRLLSALIFGLLAGMVIPLAAQEKPDAAYVRSLELQWTESYKQHQVDILASLLADDFVITIEDGSTYSKTGYISHSAEPSVHVEVAEMSDLKVRMHGNTAVINWRVSRERRVQRQTLRVSRPVHGYLDEERGQMAGCGVALQRAREVAIRLSPATAPPNTRL